jgi:hypothetical protein
MIRQKSSALATETKFPLGFGPRLLSSAGGPARVATTYKAIAENRTTNVRAIMTRYKDK